MDDDITCSRADLATPPEVAGLHREVGYGGGVVGALRLCGGVDFRRPPRPRTGRRAPRG